MGSSNIDDMLNIIYHVAEVVIRGAIGFDYKSAMSFLPPSIHNIVINLIDTLRPQLIRETPPTLYCGLCGRGPFTRKGLYLHLKRVHIDLVSQLVREELRHRLWASKNYFSSMSGGAEHAH